MKQVVFFVDGFNIYHALKENQEFHKYKWLNLKSLCVMFLSKNENLKSVFYFTAITPWNPLKRERHEKLIRAYKNENIQVVEDKFKKITKTCLADCKKEFKTYEEKQTDVNIAIYLLKLHIKTYMIKLLSFQQTLI